MAEKTYRVGVIGFGHMHINDVARRFNEVKPRIEWVACADTVPDVPEAKEATFTRGWNLKYAQREIGIPKAYDDYREMLQKEKLDLVLIYSENSKHPEIVEAVAKAGSAMVVEKPMAKDLSDALAMVRSAKAHGVELFVNWPSTWNASTWKVKEVLDQGAIGKPYELKYRAGHAGPLASGAQHQGIKSAGLELTDAERAKTWWHRKEAGGGALLDYISYGGCFSRWYFGEPAVAAIALAGNFMHQYTNAEDNAIVAVRFPSAMALLEASWSTFDHGANAGPIVYGTEGTLSVERREGEQVIRVARGRGHEPEYIPVGELPAGRGSLAQEMVRHFDTGEPVHPTIEPLFNLDAFAILDAGKRSVESGKLELVNTATWNIG